MSTSITAAPRDKPQKTHLGWTWSAEGYSGIEATEQAAYTQMRLHNGEGSTKQ